jgi:lipopolysaccharide export LptBFGC system permease protein LptF
MTNLTNVVTQESVDGTHRVFHLDLLSASARGLVATGFHLYESGAATREVHALGGSWTEADRTWSLTDGKAVTYDSMGRRSEEAVSSVHSSLLRIRYLHHLEPVSFRTPELWALRGGAIFNSEMHSRYSFTLGLALLGLLVILATATLTRTAPYAAIAFALVASLIWYGAGFLLTASSTAVGPVLSAWLLPVAVGLVAGHRWVTTES